jgi:guanylate kinase
VWIFGPTAVGKNKLIQKVVSEPNHLFTTILGLQAPIIANQSSLEFRQNQRDTLEVEIAKDKLKGTTILIKGQGFDIDNGNNTPKRLKELCPNDEHIFLYLDASAETLKKRREKRGEANSINDEGARRDMVRIAKEFEKNGFKLSWFNNDSDELPTEIQRLI